jgi:hypothetical protein
VFSFQCKGSGYFGDEIAQQSTDKATISGYELSANEIFIGKLLFHFQTGIQYNLHAVYQVNQGLMLESLVFEVILLVVACDCHGRL